MASLGVLLAATEAAWGQTNPIKPPAPPPGARRAPAPRPSPGPSLPPLAKADEASSPGASATTADPYLGALSEVLAQHPALKADRLAIVAAEEAILASFSGFLPVLRSDAELNQAALWRATGATRLSGRAVSLEVEQMLFDNWRVGSRCAAAYAERYALEQDYRANAMTVAANFARAYLGVLRDQAILAAARRNHQEHQRSLNQIASAVVNDPGKAFDLEQIRAREAFAASLVVEREAALATSEGQYRELAGRPPGRLARPAGWSGPAFQSLNEAVRLSEAQHPSVLSARRRQEGRAFLRREAEGALVPRLDLNGRYIRGEDRSGIAGQNDEAFIGLRASYVFPVGGALWATRQNLAKLEQAAAERVAAAQRDLREQLRVLWAQRQGLVQSLPKVKEHWRRTQNVMAAYRLQYTLGRRTILDLLIIQNEAYQAEARYLQLEHDALIADHQLAATMGLTEQQMAFPKHRPPGEMPAWVAEQRYPWMAPDAGSRLDPAQQDAEASRARALGQGPQASPEAPRQP